MDPEGIGEVRSTLAAFPGLAEVTVVEHDADQAGQCLIAYVVPSGPGLDVPTIADLFKAATPSDMGRRLSLLEERK